MATYSPSTAVRAAKGAPFVSSDGSPVRMVFSRFLSATAELIAAERDLAGCAGYDPAVDNWIRDAERAVEAVKTVVADLLAVAPRDAGDRQLQRIGGLFRFVMLSDDPAAVDAVRRHFCAGTMQFSAGGDRDAGAFGYHLARAGRQRLLDFLALDDGLAPAGVESAATVADDAPLSAAASLAA